MRKAWQKQLANELRAAGASNAELRQLLTVAAGLRQLNDAAKPTLESNEPHRRFRSKTMLSVALGGLLAVFLLVVISQSVLPSNALYPIQRLSDNIAIKLNPGYRADVMMKRAVQVKELARRHADSKTVLAALNDYNSEAILNKNLEHANHGAYEYCESNLRQASKLASPDVRKSIETSLKSLDET